MGEDIAERHRDLFAFMTASHLNYQKLDYLVFLVNRSQLQRFRLCVKRKRAKKVMKKSFSITSRLSSILSLEVQVH